MKKYKKIPDEYLPEFIEKQTKLLKSRVRLFCLLSVGIYFLATVLSFLVFEDEFKSAEIPVWIFLIACSLLVIYLTKIARTLRFAKFNAYLFSVLLLAIITRVCALYPEDIIGCSTVYLFTLFVMSFTIPWKPLEMFPVTLMNLAAYSLFFLFARNYTPSQIIAGYTFAV